MQFIDFHTHKKSPSNHVQVYNHLVKPNNSLVAEGYFTAGVHPWYIEDTEAQCLELEKYVSYKNCIAVGECGLDKVCKTNSAVQHIAFVQQCRIALAAKKPMVIHCVKAHFDVIKTLKEESIRTAVFHGYNTRYTILEKILQEDYMVSFGAAILHPKSQAAALLPAVPFNRFFLETDDAENTIDEIYACAANILHLSLDELTAQQNLNFKHFIA